MAREAGRVANWGGDCHRCPQPIVPGISRVVYVNGHWIHVECASGQDE